MKKEGKGKFGQVWTSLVKFGQVWTSLDKFGLICTMNVLLEIIQASSAEERLENLRKLRSLVTQSDFVISQDGKSAQIDLL